MLTGSTLERILSYNPTLGELRWVKAPGNNSRLNGQVAGRVRDDGYIQVRIGGQLYYGGRLAFLWMTGRWPEPEVDYIDRDPGNIKWDNLREATSSQNKYNRRFTDGVYRGVYPCGDKWQVQVGGIYLGLFNTLEEAIASRDETATEWSDGFATLNSSKEIH